MPLTFPIHPNAHLVEEYREILLSDWDQSALDRALALAHQTLHDEDPTGFYRDVRSLVFRLAVEHLLPTLLQQEPGYAYFLAGTLSEFARTAWDDQPQHRDTLLAELFEQLGRKDEARGLRESALHATSPDAHEYLTKAQALIHTLLELDEVDAAELELFRVIRATSGAQDEELQGMLRDIHVARGVRLAGGVRPSGGG